MGGWRLKRNGRWKRGGEGIIAAEDWTRHDTATGCTGWRGGQGNCWFDIGVGGGDELPHRHYPHYQAVESCNGLYYHNNSIQLAISTVVMQSAILIH